MDDSDRGASIPRATGINSAFSQMGHCMGGDELAGGRREGR
jgi:hypothetical protein